jgi:hypothetical protein
MPLGPGPMKLADTYSPRYRTPLVVAAPAGTAAATAILAAAAMAAVAAAADLVAMRMSNPFGHLVSVQR